MRFTNLFGLLILSLVAAQSALATETPAERKVREKFESIAQNYVLLEEVKKFAQDAKAKEMPLAVEANSVEARKIIANVEKVCDTGPVAAKPTNPASINLLPTDHRTDVNGKSVPVGADLKEGYGSNACAYNVSQARAALMSDECTRQGNLQNIQDCGRTLSSLTARLFPNTVKAAAPSTQKASGTVTMQSSSGSRVVRPLKNPPGALTMGSQRKPSSKPSTSGDKTGIN